MITSSGAARSAHRIEFFRLAIAQDDHDGVYRWASRFVHAWMANDLAECRLLLAGVKGSGIDLSPHSQGVVLRCQALLEMLLDEAGRAEVDFRHSLALFDQTGDDFNASRVLNDLGTLRQRQGNLADAVVHYRQALARLLPRWAGATEEAMMHNNLGLALYSLGDYRAARTELEAALAAYRQLGQPQGAARVQINLGQLLGRQGDLTAATAAYQEALDILRAFDDQREIVEVLNSLGVLYRQQGRFDQAITHYVESLALAQQLQDLSGQAQALVNLGAVYHRQGHLAKARACYQEALPLYEMLSDVRGQALTLANLGHLDSLDGRQDAAQSLYERSLTLYRQSGDTSGAARALINLGNLRREAGAADEAEAFYVEALAHGRQAGDVQLQEAALGALATLRMMAERWDEAEDYLRQALGLQKRRGDLHAQVETTYKFAIIAKERGQYEQVASILQPAWELAQEHGYGRWLVNMAWLLGDTAFEQQEPGAYNYYATAVGIARQYQDEERYRKGLDILTDHIADPVSGQQAHAARQLCQYLIGYWIEQGWESLLEEAIASLHALAAKIQAEES